MASTEDVWCRVIGGTPLSGIKTMYVNSLAYVIVKGGKSECSINNSFYTH